MSGQGDGGWEAAEDERTNSIHANDNNPQIGNGCIFLGKKCYSFQFVISAVF
jgi:hypothetical protein